MARQPVPFVKIPTDNDVIDRLQDRLVETLRALTTNPIFGAPDFQIAEVAGTSGATPTLALQYRSNNAWASVAQFAAQGMPQVGLGNTAAPPTAAAAYAGMIWYQFGGAGVKDSVVVCAKSAADVWAWRTIY